MSVFGKLVMEDLGEDLIGEGKGAAEQRLVLCAGEAAQFRLVQAARVGGCRIGGNKCQSAPAQPWPKLAGGDRGRMLAEKREPDSGNRCDHGHAYLPGIQHDKGGGPTAGHDGGGTWRSFGWGSVHRCSQGFGSYRRRCGMTRLVK
jgi:hypothetical protein